MRLKYKLLFSYFILIAFLSLALILQITQIRHLDLTTRVRVEQNVQEVIDISYQQHVLERVYDQYLLFNFPGEQKEKYRTSLVNTVRDFTRGWDNFKSRRSEIPDFNILPLFDLLFRKFTQTEELVRFEQKKLELEENCERIWAESHAQILNDVQHGENHLRTVKADINTLRTHLTDLSTTIGEEARYSGLVLENVTGLMQKMIIGIVGSTVLLSIGIAFTVTRKISRPVEELRRGVEQVAIQNYDVHISHKTNDEIGDLAAAFQQMALRLKKNETFKTDMLSQFTHEMKSPLGAIKQAVNLLGGENGQPLSEKDRIRLLSIIKGNNDNLFRLISNILRTTTYQEDKIKLTFAWENIATLLSNVLILISPSIKKKNMKVHIDYASEKVDCEVDAERMREAFHNLVSNAVKFSRDNSQLFVTVQEKYPAVIIKIRDQGIGIPKEEIPYIFEKMYRASNSKNISVKGTGLGLFVVSQIIRGHGGRINVQSTVGEGTEFTLTLPRSRQIAIEGEWM